MKRYLIFIILISFVTVSCAGPNKVGWTKPDFRQDEFERDKKECIQTLDNTLDPEALEKRVEECLDKKGYYYQTSESHQTAESNILEDYVIPIALIPVSPIFLGLGFGCMLFYGIFHKDEPNPCCPH
jgi:hypothetical protein